MIKLSLELVQTMDLSDLVKSVNRKDHKRLINAAAGQQHYKLLAYLASQIDGNIVELGTHHGTSSLAMSKYCGGSITTIDVVDRYGIVPQPKNVSRLVSNIMKSSAKALLLDATMIFMDTAHDGTFEKLVYDYLLESDYSGILLLDDIHFNTAMKNFWDGIRVRKYDITYMGHGHCKHLKNPPGTGIVDFGKNIEVLDI